jgi:hypothetical protein
MAKKKLKPSPARDFAAIAKIYGTRDPQRIQLRIIWHYVSLLSETQLTPGQPPGSCHPRPAF